MRNHGLSFENRHQDNNNAVYPGGPGNPPATVKPTVRARPSRGEWWYAAGESCLGSPPKEAGGRGNLWIRKKKLLCDMGG